MPVVIKKRGAAYCMNTLCLKYAAAVFLLDRPLVVQCTGCHRPMHVVMDSGYREGSQRVVGRVRVEFNYDPVSQLFREGVELQDDALPRPFDTYVYKTPLINTDKRATLVAHRIMFMENLTDATAPGEVILNFDAPLSDVKSQCERVASLWATNAILTEVR